MSMEYLQRGLPAGHQLVTADTYALFSDMYIPGQRLTTARICKIHDGEVNSIPVAVTAEYGNYLHWL